MRALRGTLSIVSVAVILLSSLVAFADESSTLLTLSNQAFTALHNATVVLPNSTTERISRSTAQLPPGWPTGQKKGLIEKQYMDQAFQATSLAALSAGVIMSFVNVPENFTTYVTVYYHAPTQQLLFGGYGVHPGRDLEQKLSTLSSGSNPCDSTSDNIQCSGTDCPCGTGSRVCDCAGASCASGDIWFNTGEKDQWQNPIYNCVMGSCQGEEMVGCGTLGIVNLVQVLSPRDLPY